MTVETEASASKSPDTSLLTPLFIRLARRVRFISFLAVLSSLLGSLLMFIIGTVNTYKAFAIFLGFQQELLAATGVDPGEEATLQLLESLDNFLVGLTFFFFSYGIYSLCIRLGETNEDDPKWLQVNNIATLKKTLLEVLVVLLSVVFVKGLLERSGEGILQWPVLVIPASIIALALSIRLMSKESSEEA
ncbi:MAG: YqhA family protein [Synechococcaceae cyanobacterium SM2_3_1]|nr:YqhA family protein [Synechococcaceae cyanobacterium SM2_3_1]